MPVRVRPPALKKASKGNLWGFFYNSKEGIITARKSVEGRLFDSSEILVTSLFQILYLLVRYLPVLFAELPSIQIGIWRIQQKMKLDM
ncbi:hypothetical protein IZU99_07995 [Oscillospiraceae bacterium CM]|nr:hypothetical protein IZU99_07995 [Oscillospiraceae bacterium CM]